MEIFLDWSLLWSFMAMHLARFIWQPGKPVRKRSRLTNRQMYWQTNASKFIARQKLLLVSPHQTCQLYGCRDLAKCIATPTFPKVLPCFKLRSTQRKLHSVTALPAGAQSLRPMLKKRNTSSVILLSEKSRKEAREMWIMSFCSPSYVLYIRIARLGSERGSRHETKSAARYRRLAPPDKDLRRNGFRFRVQLATLNLFRWSGPSKYSDVAK